MSQVRYTIIDGAIIGMILKENSNYAPVAVFPLVNDFSDAIGIMTMTDHFVIAPFVVKVYPTQGSQILKICDIKIGT